MRLAGWCWWPARACILGSRKKTHVHRASWDESHGKVQARPQTPLYLELEVRLTHVSRLSRKCVRVSRASGVSGIFARLIVWSFDFVVVVVNTQTIYDLSNFNF